MSISVFLAILVTSLATFSSRFLGAISSQGIKETSKLFKWFNCLAYSTLAALIARTIIFPVGLLSDASYLCRIVVVLFCLIIFFISKRNFVYPTVISAIIMASLSNYLWWKKLLKGKKINSVRITQIHTLKITSLKNTKLKKFGTIQIKFFLYYMLKKF